MCATADGRPVTPLADQVSTVCGSTNRCLRPWPQSHHNLGGCQRDDRNWLDSGAVDYSSRLVVTPQSVAGALSSPPSDWYGFRGNQEVQGLS